MDIYASAGQLTNLGAGWVLWLLLGLSVIAVGIVIERIAFFVSSRDDLGLLMLELRGLLERGDYARARRRLEESPALEARVAAAGLGANTPGSAEERMLAETELVKTSMLRRLAFLGTLGNNAPFVGLLGTVIGIIRAFQELDASDGQLSTGLMAEIGEALVATGIGLIVALPAVAAFNLFQQTVKVRLAHASALGREILAHLKADRTPAE
jgi:biopolymer transport protein ExbB/TolQ